MQSVVELGRTCRERRKVGAVPKDVLRREVVGCRMVKSRSQNAPKVDDNHEQE